MAEKLRFAQVCGIGTADSARLNRRQEAVARPPNSSEMARSAHFQWVRRYPKRVASDPPVLQNLGKICQSKVLKVRNLGLLA